MALNKCANTGKAAQFHVEVVAGATPTMTGTPDTYLCAHEVLKAIADGNSVKGVTVYGEGQKLGVKRSTAVNRTLDDAMTRY